MEKRAIKKASRSNIFYIVVLLLVVFVLTITSLGIKFIKLLSDSSFNTPSFNVLILDKDARVVHIDRSNHEIAIFKIKDARSEVEKLSNLGAALTFHVPIDARITYKNHEKEISDDQFFSFKNSLGSLFNTRGAHYTNMNSSDVLKIYIAARSIDTDNTRKINRDKSYLKDPNKNIDDELSDAFRDESIVNEKISLEIVNGTGVAGFGSRMSQVLENAGYNVISVKNGDHVSSQITNRTNSLGYTQKYLHRFLGLPIRSDSSTPVADISIIFGK